MPFSEPWRTTVLRTGSIALGIGLGVGLYQRHLAVVPVVTLLALWFTLGGHYVELLFRNRLGPLRAIFTGQRADCRCACVNSLRSTMAAADQPRRTR